MEQEFKLKHGMLFRTGGGKFGVILKNADGGFIFASRTWGEVTCDSLSDNVYTKKQYENNKLRIAEIYIGYSCWSFSGFGLLSDFYQNPPKNTDDSRLGKSVWTFSPQVKEVTLAEVATAMGIPVEQLRIKDAK